MVSAKKRSCETQLITTVNYFANNEEQVDALLLDFS